MSFFNPRINNGISLKWSFEYIPKEDEQTVSFIEVPDYDPTKDQLSVIVGGVECSSSSYVKTDKDKITFNNPVDTNLFEIMVRCFG
ncbi:hypothetical protein CEY02_20850 [Bacillus pumilus]|uniref:Uncharacterized protein n=1 Tax=Bacillus pumilus TaxID=1408 RepID=A0A2A5IE38_BACPU|nr:hypothetical protein [Bacillus pumilus]PCK15376.1 hypothetical protein CEY02_20850 [Bacillus pumilus]